MNENRKRLADILSSRIKSNILSSEVIPILHQRIYDKYIKDYEKQQEIKKKALNSKRKYEYKVGVYKELQEPYFADIEKRLPMIEAWVEFHKEQQMKEIEPQRKLVNESIITSVKSNANKQLTKQLITDIDIAISDEGINKFKALQEANKSNETVFKLMDEFVDKKRADLSEKVIDDIFKRSLNKIDKKQQQKVAAKIKAATEMGTEMTDKAIELEIKNQKFQDFLKAKEFRKAKEERQIKLEVGKDLTNKIKTATEMATEMTDKAIELEIKNQELKAKKEKQMRKEYKAAQKEVQKELDRLLKLKQQKLDEKQKVGKDLTDKIKVATKMATEMTDNLIELEVAREERISKRLAEKEALRIAQQQKQLEDMELYRKIQLQEREIAELQKQERELQQNLRDKERKKLMYKYDKIMEADDFYEITTIVKLDKYIDDIDKDIAKYIPTMSGSKEQEIYNASITKELNSKREIFDNFRTSLLQQQEQLLQQQIQQLQEEEIKLEQEKAAKLLKGTFKGFIKRDYAIKQAKILKDLDDVKQKQNKAANIIIKAFQQKTKVNDKIKQGKELTNKIKTTTEMATEMTNKAIKEQLLDYEENDKKQKQNAAEILKEVIKRRLEQPFNPNDDYNTRNLKISNFFIKKEAQLDKKVADAEKVIKDNTGLFKSLFSNKDRKDKLDKANKILQNYQLEYDLLRLKKSEMQEKSHEIETENKLALIRATKQKEANIRAAKQEEVDRKAAQKIANKQQKRLLEQADYDIFIKENTFNNDKKYIDNAIKNIKELSYDKLLTEIDNSRKIIDNETAANKERVILEHYELIEKYIELHKNYVDKLKQRVANLGQFPLEQKDFIIQKDIFRQNRLIIDDYIKTLDSKSIDFIIKEQANASKYIDDLEELKRTATIPDFKEFIDMAISYYTLYYNKLNNIYKKAKKDEKFVISDKELKDFEKFKIEYDDVKNTIDTNLKKLNTVSKTFLERMLAFEQTNVTELKNKIKVIKNPEYIKLIQKLIDMREKYTDKIKVQLQKDEELLLPMPKSEPLETFEDKEVIEYEKDKVEFKKWKKIIYSKIAGIDRFDDGFLEKNKTKMKYLIKDANNKIKTIKLPEYIDLQNQKKLLYQEFIDAIDIRLKDLEQQEKDDERAATKVLNEALKRQYADERKQDEDARQLQMGAKTKTKTSKPEVEKELIKDTKKMEDIKAQIVKLNQEREKIKGKLKTLKQPAAITKAENRKDELKNLMLELNIQYEELKTKLNIGKMEEGVKKSGEGLLFKSRPIINEEQDKIISRLRLLKDLLKGENKNPNLITEFNKLYKKLYKKANGYQFLLNDIQKKKDEDEKNKKKKDLKGNANGDGVKPKTREVKTDKIEQDKDRLRLIEGEIKAGNNNTKLILELNKLYKKIYKIPNAYATMVKQGYAPTPTEDARPKTTLRKMDKPRFP